jgi:hypothetical protein
VLKKEKGDGHLFLPVSVPFFAPRGVPAIRRVDRALRQLERPAQSAIR